MEKDFEEYVLKKNNIPFEKHKPFSSYLARLMMYPLAFMWQTFLFIFVLVFTWIYFERSKRWKQEKQFITIRCSLARKLSNGPTGRRWQPMIVLMLMSLLLTNYLAINIFKDLYINFQWTLMSHNNKLMRKCAVGYLYIRLLWATLFYPVLYLSRGCCPFGQYFVSCSKIISVR